MANRITSYIGESKDELKKVVWPSRAETTRNTAIVIGISLAVAAFLGLADFVLTYLLDRFILQ